VRAAIRRVSLASLGKMGCLLGVVAAFLPSLLCGLAGLLLANLARGWLESWQELTISFLGQEIASIDLVRILGLEQVLSFLQTLASASVPMLFLVVLILALGSGAMLALIIALVGLAYNLLAAATGGVIVELTAVAAKGKDH
jgi:hypothetical protein